MQTPAIAHDKYKEAVNDAESPPSMPAPVILVARILQLPASSLSGLRQALQEVIGSQGDLVSIK